MGNPNGTTGQRIVAARMALNLSQGELAEELGLTRPGLVLYERDMRKPSVQMLKRIGKICKKPWQDLIQEDDIQMKHDLKLPLDAPSPAPRAKSETMGERWDRLRRESGLSTTAFCAEIGLSTSHYGKIHARGTIDLSASMAVRAARALSKFMGHPITVEHLICMDDESAEKAPSKVVPLRTKANAPAPQASLVDDRLDLRFRCLESRLDARLDDVNRRMEEAGKMIAFLAEQLISRNATPQPTAEPKSEDSHKQTKKSARS